MGTSFSKAEDPNRYLEVPREQYLSLGLATPPVNGFDDFLKLIWCRDLKDERRQAKEAEKKKQEVVIVKKYYLCLVGIYQPYRENDPPINLAKVIAKKAKKGQAYNPLPKWTDDDYMEEILRNGNFFQNDAFILEKYPQAIRPAEDYPYVEQYVKAYQHWNGGQRPTDEQIREHKISVVATIMERLDRYESEEGNSNEETIQRLKDIIESMQVEPEDIVECKKRAEVKKAGRK